MATQSSSSSSGSKKTRHVASQAGVTRYGKPIGSEIGGPRDANHAAIQKNQGARTNYQNLISGDPKAQAKYLDGLNSQDLNNLADIAFSFKSSDPKVVQLRIAARNAQARRGIHVKPGQTQTSPTAGKAAPTVNYNNKGAAKALSREVGPASQRLIELASAAATKPKDTSKLGNFPIPDVAHLRKAISAIGRAKPEHRPLIARHIIARAQKLNASHLVSDHIKHYARGHRQPGTVGMSRGESGAIELAGRWKHGYIPLDAEALASKMKGRTGGKKWWGDHASGGASGKLHSSPKSGSPSTGGKVTKVVKSGSPTAKPRGAKVDKPHPLTRSRKPISQMSPAERTAEANRADQMASRQPDRSAEWESLAKQLRSEQSTKASNPKLDHGRTEIARINAEHDAAVRKAKAEGTTPPKFPYDRVKQLQKVKPTEYKTPDDVRRDVLAGKITPQQGNTLLEELARKNAPKSRTIPDKPAEKVTGLDLGTGKTQTRAVVRDNKGKVIGTNKTGAAKSAQTRRINDSLGAFAPKNQPKTDSGPAAATPQVTKNGERYIQMHGTAGARQKVAQLEARGHLTSPEKVQLAGLKAALAAGTSGKA